MTDKIEKRSEVVITIGKKVIELTDDELEILEGMLSKYDGSRKYIYNT